MERSYDNKDKKSPSRESIIGLGEESFRKNYYPELLEKINDLEQVNARNRALISTMPDLLFVGNANGDITPFAFYSPSNDRMIQAILYNANIMDIMNKGVTRALREGTLITIDFQLSEDSVVQYFEARFQKSETGEVLIMVRNMTERIHLEKQLRMLAERDSLTSIYNRRSFEQTMKKYDQRYVEKLTVLSIDINGLKFINDTLGHFFGDKIIVDAVSIINRIFSEIGHVARIGGDEFGIILEGIEESQVEVLLSRMNQKVKQYNSRGKDWVLSLSYGYAFLEKGTVNVEYMFQEADNNMYQNKLLKKESTHSTFVKTFMRALEAKDFVSEGHVARMERLAVFMGEILLLRQDQVDRLALLTKFHDIGKIGIPDNILKKPAKLTDDEWKIMRTHPAIGERIALESTDLKDIAPLILRHHERYDGKGYPLGIAGDEIPIECRILAIVDTFDAMTNDRPYSKAVTRDDAENEIRRCSGTQFDPLMVEVFILVINDYVD